MMMGSFCSCIDAAVTAGVCATNLQVGLCSVGEAAAAAPATPKASRPAMGSPAPASLASPSPSRFGPAHTPALNASEVQLVDLAQRAGVCRDDTGVAAGGSEALSAAAEGMCTSHTVAPAWTQCLSAWASV